MIPLSFLFAVSGYALVIKLSNFGGSVWSQGWASPVLHVFIVGLLIVFIAIWLLFEAVWAFLYNRSPLTEGC